MAELNYKDSVYRFTDPVRYFKANDPYFFEVDNMPLKQLQENCLWLKDQLVKEVDPTASLGAKRVDLDELRPYANGADRLVRVKPGRYTARVNDAWNREPLSYLKGFTGGGPGEVDSFQITAANEGNFPEGLVPSWNTLLVNVLNKYKSILSQDSIGMTGLENRVFARPQRHPNVPIGGVNSTTQTASGVDWEIGNHGEISYTGEYFGELWRVPAVVQEALEWARTTNNELSYFTLHTLDTDSNSFTMMSQLESQFIKRWRGIARTAIVDVSDEITVEIPPFDPTDFDYFKDPYPGGGPPSERVTIDGIQSRIDMVFIYSKTVDASSAQIFTGGITPNSPGTTITKPTLGVCRGAGLKMHFDSHHQASVNAYGPYNAVDSEVNPEIMAWPADQFNENLGFTATSANDIAYDVRGTFPAPDDILNVAPLLLQQLENTAIELVGQSVLPVAYIWVQNGSTVVATTDVIDIRPFFRTAELTYNERAGLAAASPQLSISNPAVGSAEMDYEIRRVKTQLDLRIDNIEAMPGPPGPPGPPGAEGGTGGTGAGGGNGVVVPATGYVFGGLAFGPEGAMYDYMSQRKYQQSSPRFDDVDVLDAMQNGLTSKVGASFGADIIETPLPVKPQWEKAKWTELNALEGPAAGLAPNDYITTFMATGDLRYPSNFPTGDCRSSDASIVAGSIASHLTPSEDASNDPDDPRQGTFLCMEINCNKTGARSLTNAVFHFVKKKIKFNRPPNMVDYHVNVQLLNCLSPRGQGVNFSPGGTEHASSGNYGGIWVEKGKDATGDGMEFFTIYVGWIMSTPNIRCTWGTDDGEVVSKGASMIQPHKIGSTWYVNRFGSGAGAPGSGSGTNAERFAAWIVPIQNMLEQDMDPVTDEKNVGYLGNPRVGKCTLPSVSWTMTAITADAENRNHRDLNTDDQVIDLLM